MKHTSHHQKNGHYAGKKDAVYMDLRVPFAVCAAVGLVLLGACAMIGRLNVPSLPLGWFGIGALSVFAVTCAVLFLIYLLRYLRLREAIAASEQISTDVYDMFRYVIDVPYAVIGRDGVVKFVVDSVVNAGGNPCPPTVIGVGIGGTMEHAAYLAKKALLRPVGTPSTDPRYAELEAEILEKVNASGVGPQGLGGSVTSLSCHIEFFPCHLASLPVAVNLNCHAARHAEVEI